MSQKHSVTTPNAPSVIGPFSQATTNGDLVYTAGQAALDADGNSFVDDSIHVQTKQCLENISAILEDAGTDLSNILKVTVFLADMDDYEAMNETYETFFDDEPPARTALEVSRLPLDADVEIQAVAAKP